jgi:two-component system, LuxR family, sensor kinase FixL
VGAIDEFQALMDAAVDGIVIVDHAGCIQAFNRAAERLFGYSAAEIMGADVSVLAPEPDKSAHDGYMARFLGSGEPHVIGRGREVEACRKDGSVFPAFLSVGLVAHSQPPRFVGFIQDITLQRRAEEEAHRLQERLTHVSRLATVGEMSAGIAHELNQPLAAVANYAQACDRLLMLADPDIPEIRDALKQITGQAVRAGDIIRRLRALARNEDMQREPTDINGLVSELSDLIQLDAKRYDVQYKLDLARHLPQIEVDRAQIQQVVLNLVRNGLEALGDSAHAPRQLTVQTQHMSDGTVEIKVSDNGPGVSSTITPRLFEPFCTTKPHGTGLGLAISRTIVKSHQGNLDYRPGHLGGASFSLRLPVTEQD